MINPIGNRRVKARKEALVKIITDNRDKHWYICSHDNPDPDSLSSCLGMAHILTFLGVENHSIVYCGEVSHPQNRAMVNVLQVPMSKWEPESQIPDSLFIFVDTVPGNKNMSIRAAPTIVIDHHKAQPTNRDVLFIHDESGACATLVFDLALSITLPGTDGEPPLQCFDPEGENAKELATALAIGIKTDTLDFLSETTTPDDFNAFRILGTFLSDEKFSKIVHYEFPPYVLDFEQIAWHNKRPDYQPHFITGLGFLDEAKSDCIPHIADKFRRLQGVQTVVVFGVVGNSIRASVRTSSASIDCLQLCEAIFGKGNSGAKYGIGGAKVQLSVFNPNEMEDDEKESLWKLIKSEIERKFNSAITAR